MALYSHKLSKPKYHNWVKATLAVLLTKEGIEPFVYKELHEFQLKCLDDICYDNGLLSGATCSNCSTENVVACPTRQICNVQHRICKFHGNTTASARCPNNICHHFKDRIQKSHHYHGPSYKNTDAARWCINPWEVAKCFMPPDGYKDVTSPVETDFNGINSIILNYKGFQAKINDRNIFEKARLIGRDVRHSPNLEIDATDLHKYFTDLNTLLSDPGYLANDNNAQEAQHKLLQLQNDKLPLGEVYIRKVLDELDEVIKENMEKELDESKRQQKEENLKLLEESKKTIETLFQDKEKHVYSQIDIKLLLAVDAIEKRKSEIVEKLGKEASNKLALIQKEIQTSGDKQVAMVQQEMQISGDKQVAMVQQEIQTSGDKQVAMVQQEMQISGDKQVAMVKKEIRTSGDKQVTLIQKEIQTSGDKQVAMVQKEIQTSGNQQFKRLKKTSDAIKKRKSEALKELDTVASNRLTQIQTSGDQQVKRVKQASDEKDEKIMNDLQNDLISFYRDQHHKISLSPLLQKETPLLEFYVLPDIYSVQNTLSGDKKEKKPVTPLRNLFYNNDNMCRKIYLTADAGLGKTALSKRLALSWCHAKKPHTKEGQYFSQEDIEALNEFGFVFLLLLRNCSNECEIDDLIWNQIISRLGHKYTQEDLVNILCNERCLVILDGLDEWSHPSNSCKQGWSPIPHQKVRDRTAVLTTTRPWKLSVSHLQSGQIDQKLVLVKLNKTSAKALKESVISYLCNEKNEDKLQWNVAKFTSDVEERQISDLKDIPLLLMYLLFLWCNKIELGQTQCDLYSQITELLLSRTVQNWTELAPKVDLHQGDIPQCFSGNAQCMQFYTLLTSLGQLAYETLFNEKREENTLVFDGSVAEQYLKKSMNFCLKTGLITQSKVSVPENPLKQKFKVSFAHKTVQEFFAALYMHSTSDQTSVPEIVLSKCKCIKDILEMSRILIFSCGMNVNVPSLISREMMKIINEGEITLKYRSSLESSTSKYGLSHPLKDFQDMCISCCREIPRENDVSLCLQDVFIEKSCQQEQYRENLKQLTTRNKQNIRSLYINMGKMSETPYSSVHDVIDYFALSELENMEKIHYQGKYNDHDILPLLNKSVKCLRLSCSDELGSWSRLLGEKVTSLQKLEAINISRFKMSHSELTLLYDYISHIHCMRQIELERLSCVEHVLDSCSVCLELSHHSQLNTLELEWIPVSELNINMASLEKCSLLYLSNPDLVLRFINCVPANSKLNTFKCDGLKPPVAIETMLETLRVSVNVEHVELLYMKLGDNEMLSAEMVNIKYVELWGVTMNASVLQGTVDILQQQQQTVTVDIRFCDIKPESEFVKVKQKIKTSREHFRILEDSEDWFKFETIKQ